MAWLCTYYFIGVLSSVCMHKQCTQLGKGTQIQIFEATQVYRDPQGPTTSTSSALHFIALFRCTTILPFQLLLLHYLIG